MDAIQNLLNAVIVIILLYALVVVIGFLIPIDPDRLGDDRDQIGPGRERRAGEVVREDPVRADLADDLSWRHGTSTASKTPGSSLMSSATPRTASLAIRSVSATTIATASPS